MFYYYGCSNVFRYASPRVYRCLTRLGVERGAMTSLGLPFLIHRSFSWLVLGLLAYMAYKNERTYKYKSYDGYS